MEHSPLPPHERTWRHPSELAAQEHALARAQTATSTTRVFAFTTGTLGLLAVGLLIIAVTPDGSEPPVAVSATTSVDAGDQFPTVSRVAATDSSVDQPIPLRGRPEAMATPIGEGQLAVVTAADLATSAGATVIGAAVEVEVPSGRMHDARVIGVVGDTVVVELERTEPGIDLAVEHPDGHEIVTVLTEPPVTIVLDDLPSLAFDEGTAVIDGDGDLVGLCSQGSGDATRLILVSGELLRRDASELDAELSDWLDDDALGDDRRHDERGDDQREDDQLGDDQLGDHQLGDHQLGDHQLGDHQLDDHQLDDDQRDDDQLGDELSDEPAVATTGG